MVLTDENDWEVISASDDQSSSEEEEDLIVDGKDEEDELRRQLLPSEFASTIGEEAVPNDLLQPLTSDAQGSDVVNNTSAAADDVPDETCATAATDTVDDAVKTESFHQDDATDTTPLISEHLADTVVVSKSDASSSSAQDEEQSKDATDSSFQHSQGDSPPQPEPRGGPPKFVASLGASVKHIGDAIGKEGQKIGLVVQKEGQKLGSSIQKESLKLGKAIEEETKRIGRAFQIKSRSPSPSATPRHRPEHSPPRSQTDVAVEQQSSLIANVLTGAAVLAGGILLARGNKGAGAALLATGGATFMAHEAAKESRRFDSNLNEELGMHMN